MNNHEYYVSLEVAKLLREAGFDWEVDACYTYGDYFDFLPRPKNCNEIEHWHSAPTLSVAQKWLREVKGIEIEIHCENYRHRGPKNWSNRSYNVDVWCAGEADDRLLLAEAIDMDTYEQALEEGLRKGIECWIKESDFIQSLQQKHTPTHQN